MASPTADDPLGALAATVGPTEAKRAEAALTPPWKPGYDIGTDEGTLTTGALPDDHVDWDSIFRHWNLDPDAWEVVDGSLRVNAWDGPSTEGARIYRQYKATIRRRTSGVRAVPIDDTLRTMAKWKAPKKPRVRAEGSPTFVVCAADWQVGGHGGADAFVERLTQSLASVRARALEAVAGGATRLALLYLGDMVEGCSGQYAAQAFEVDLDMRSQVRLVRHAEMLFLRELAPLFRSTTAVAVPGNHGRRTRKVETTFEDNDDLAAFEVVAELAHASGMAAEHDVSFVLPDEKLIALVDCSGTLVLAAHGDQVGGSADSLRGWWQKVGHSRWGDADAAHMLVTGHRHHLRVEEVAVDRTLVVCPTLGGDSRWFSELGGGTSLPGTLTFSAAAGKWWGLDVA